MWMEKVKREKFLRKFTFQTQSSSRLPLVWIRTRFIYIPMCLWLFFPIQNRFFFIYSVNDIQTINNFFFRLHFLSWLSWNKKKKKRSKNGKSRWRWKCDKWCENEELINQMEMKRRKKNKYCLYVDAVNLVTYSTSDNHFWTQFFVPCFHCYDSNVLFSLTKKKKL